MAPSNRPAERVRAGLTQLAKLHVRIRDASEKEFPWNP